MIRIKALNDSSDSSDLSDSEYKVTREAEEEELNNVYINALKFASNGNKEKAVELLEELKLSLEDDIPKVKDVMLIKRLKYLTYKNLGLLKNDLDFILDALDIDDSDVNLWITAGRKGKEKMNCLLAKYCFESAFKFNQSNYIVIDNLIDIYFILNDLYSCVSMCLHGLKIDSEYIKGKALINECIRLMPPLLKEMENQMSFVSVDYGGDDDCFYDTELLEHSQVMINELNNVKTKRLRCDDENENNLKSNKRQKVTMNLKLSDMKSFSQIGLQIKSIYEEIQTCFSICIPIEIIIEKSSIQDDPAPEIETNKASDNDADLSSQEKVDNQCGDNSENNEKVDEKNIDENSKTNGSGRSSKESKALYEFMDKRRSKRVKSKSSKNGEFEDDQSVFNILMEVLPEGLKTADISKSYSVDSKEYSNSCSTPSVELQKPIRKVLNEQNLVKQYIGKLEQLSSLDKPVNIFDLMESYLIELSGVKHLTIPSVFMELYKLYRDQTALPCGMFCEIGKDISIEMINVCLTANEIQYFLNETIFLTQILTKLSFNFDTESYRQFLIRLLVIRGTKELNDDFLYYALDLCSSNSQYCKYFNLVLPDSMETDEASIVNDSSRNENSNQATQPSYEVIASNKLIIDENYINTLIEMQTSSIAQLSSEKNYTEIIKLFFTKAECDLTPEDKSQLIEAIVNAEMWQKGIELFENWSELNDECLKTILDCVTTGKRARMTAKLISKIVKFAAEGNSVLPWLILYWSFIANGVDFEDPDTILIKFFKMGHSFLGKKGICTDYDGEFLLFAQKVFTIHELEDEAEQCFSCLFNYPPRKSSQYSTLHTSPHIEIKWDHCTDIYTYFAPEEMPEFDSHARQTGLLPETKDLFLKILRLLPEEHQSTKHCYLINNYITNGDSLEDKQSLPVTPITSTIYYLLADFFFKAKDFTKAKQFYIFDLPLNLSRFDSWAGLALSINYELDQMLIEGNSTGSEKFQRIAFSVIQCFEMALKLQPKNSKLWIEFGFLSYNIASNLSRITKLSKLLGSAYGQQMGSLLKFDDMLNKAKHCFEKANDIEMNDELWLSYYMLGKVSEKSKPENLSATIKFYEWAEICLFLDGALYPKKINYYSPQYLSIEALEIHYRIHNTILKYLINNRKFSARSLRQVKLHLVRASRSPFVSHKSFSPSSFAQSQKRQSISGSQKAPSSSELVNASESSTSSAYVEPEIVELMSDVISIVAERDVKFDVNRSRNELILYCVTGLKRCLYRYQAHYKSYYRLAHYFSSFGDNHIAKAVLLGGSQNVLLPLLHFEEAGNKKQAGNYIGGLFVERKGNNLYNGIWRIPIDEIERAGNFNAHMFRCTFLLIRVCVHTEDYNVLSSVAIQLHKTPDAEKRYLNETERMALSRIAFDSCFMILKTILTKGDGNLKRVVEIIESVAQNFIKNNVFAKETFLICKNINDELDSKSSMKPSV